MHTGKISLTFSLLIVLCISSAQGQSSKPNTSQGKEPASEYTDAYWKKKLDINTYQVTRCSRTEPAFHNKYWNNHANGEYRCSNCGELLFESNDKFDSGTGWPSFSKAQGHAVTTKEDNSFGMQRQEIICRHCHAHLGHVFNDGPTPSGQRYCVNSASLDFKENKKSK